MTGNLVKSILFGVIILTAIQCKKDTDSPSITILEPTGFPNYEVFESVIVKANVSDNENIEWVKVDIINASNQRVGQEILISGNNEKEITIETAVPINDVHTLSGTYNIRVIASDGSNEGFDFHEIQINELPLERERIILVKNLGTSVQMDYLDDTNTFYTGNVFDGGLGISEVNSYDQKIHLGTYNPANFLSIFPSDLTLAGSTTILDDGSEPYFLDSYYDEIDRRTYTATHDGMINAYLSNGTLNQSFVIPDGFRPHHIATFGQYILVEQRSLDQTMRNISVYFKRNGSLFQSVPINIDLIDIIISGERVILAGSEGGTGILKEYLFDINFIGNLNSTEISGMALSACGSTSPNVIYLSSESEVNRFFLNDISATSTGSWSVGAEKMIFDKANDLVVGLNENGIIQLTGSNLVTELYTNAGLDDLEILYNK